MATRDEMHQYLNELLQPALFADFCTNGIQVEGKQEIHSLCGAVTASLKVISQAAELGADALLVHHGIFWQKDSYDIVGIVRAKLKLLLEHDISLWAYHLPLDAHQVFGNNWKAAKELGWESLAPFPAKDKQPIGVKGTFTRRHRREFAKELERYYGNSIQVVEGGDEWVSSAALVSGGAHKMLLDAAKEDVDCFITGTRDEPTWHQAYENRMNFFSVGHSASEVIGVLSLGLHLSQRYHLEWTFLAESNPF